MGDSKENEVSAGATYNTERVNKANIFTEHDKPSWMVEQGKMGWPLKFIYWWSDKLNKSWTREREWQAKNTSFINLSRWTYVHVWP